MDVSVAHCSHSDDDVVDPCMVVIDLVGILNKLDGCSEEEDHDTDGEQHLLDIPLHCVLDLHQLPSNTKHTQDPRGVESI